MIQYIVLLFYAILGALILYVPYCIFFREDRFQKLLKKIPGPPQLPVLGNTLSLLGPNEKVLTTFTEWYNLYGPRHVYRIGSWWVVALSSAKDVEKILSSQTETSKSVDYDQLIPWLGTGLLISSGKKWFHRRKLLTSAFHFKILAQFIPVFNEASINLANTLRDEKFGHDETFDVVNYISRCTLDIICETAMGLKMNAQKERDSPYINAIHRMGEIQQYRAMRPWLEPDIIWKHFSFGKEEAELIKILHEFTHKVIRERKEKFLAGRKKLLKEDHLDHQVKKKPQLAFLDLLFEVQENPDNNLTDDGIREETDTFMFEGHDTTAASVSFTIFALGCHPEIQARVHEELDEIFGDDLERHVTHFDVSRMKYLECCIKESLRLFPSVPVVARECQTDFKLDEKTVLPHGTIVLILPFNLHRDPAVFPEPEQFNPERFLPENCFGRSPFAFVPFSAGPRNCIGQKFAMLEEKIILANVLRKFKFRSEVPMEQLIFNTGLILRSKHGLKVSIRARRSTTGRVE